MNADSMANLNALETEPGLSNQQADPLNLFLPVYEKGTLQIEQ